MITGSSGVDGFQRECQDLIIFLHGGNQQGKKRVAEQKFMHVGYLTALAGIRLDNLYHCYHTVHVTTSFEEAELLVESELAKDVKGIVLEPGLVTVSAYNKTLLKTKMGCLLQDRKPGHLLRIRQDAL